MPKNSTVAATTNPAAVLPASAWVIRSDRWICGKTTRQSMIDTPARTSANALHCRSVLTRLGSTKNSATAAGAIRNQADLSNIGTMRFFQLANRFEMYSTECPFIEVMGSFCGHDLILKTALVLDDFVAND